MKGTKKYTALGTLLMLGALVFFGTGIQELAQTGTFDGVRGVAGVFDPEYTSDRTPNLTPGTSDRTPDLTPGTNDRTGDSGSLTNPLKAGSIQAFLLAIIDIILVFALPIIVLFIMYAGFLYVTAGGDGRKIETAHAALTWSVIGGVIVLGAKLIIDVIQNTVNAL